MLGHFIVARDSGVASDQSLHLADYFLLFSPCVVAAELLQLTLEATQKLSLCLQLLGCSRNTLVYSLANCHEI